MGHDCDRSIDRSIDRSAWRRQHFQCEGAWRGRFGIAFNRGPGYRIYFGWDGKLLVILLGGGTKKRQQGDIQTALRHWRTYKARKAAERPRRN